MRRISRREKLLLALKGYGSYVLKSTDTGNTGGKDSCGINIFSVTYCDGMINFKANFSVIILLGLKIHQHENMKSAASLQIVCFRPPRPYSWSHLLFCPDARNFREL